MNTSPSPSPSGSEDPPSAPPLTPEEARALGSSIVRENLGSDGSGLSPAAALLMAAVFGYPIHCLDGSVMYALGVLDDSDPRKISVALGDIDPMPYLMGEVVRDVVMERAHHESLGSPMVLGTHLRFEEDAERFVEHETPLSIEEVQAILDARKEEPE